MTPTIEHLYRQAEDQVPAMMDSTRQLDNILENDPGERITESMMISMSEIGVEEEITLVGTGEKGIIAVDRDRKTKAIRGDRLTRHGKDNRRHHHIDVQVHQGRPSESGISLQRDLARSLKKGI